jgi:hypothetical protein
VDFRKKMELEWDLGTGQALAMGEKPEKIESRIEIRYVRTASPLMLMH